MDSSYTFYTLQSRMLERLTSIHHRLGEVKARHLHFPAASLEKAYRVSAVHATLALEGNVLEPLPVARLVSRPDRTSGPAALEVVNTHSMHELLPELDPALAQDLRRAHGVLMHGLAIDAGHFRTGPMDVLYGDPIPLRVAAADNLSIQVEELLHLVENDDAPPVITSCVLHFGLIYLRPFSAGNGRLARLWQRRLLMRHWPVFAFLPLEAFIHRTEPAYYAALEYADRQGDCGGFITYLLERMDEALAELLAMPDPVRSAIDRIELFLMQAQGKVFGRKEYMGWFPEISTATASRDLREAVARDLLAREGSDRTAVYRLKVEPGHR
ncbi:MAG: Fic family protein [Flavobacteriales bacterium]|nr:Fic family protein [Flavobacteriales bacterium]